MSAIEEVKQKTDIVELIGQYVSLTKSGRTLRGLCPFHSEKTPSFFVYPEQQSWHCFGACNTGGDAFSFIMKKENLDFAEALRLLADRAGLSLPARVEPGGKEKREEKERLYQINEAAAEFFHEQLIKSPAALKARTYAENRGLDPETVKQFRLGYSPNSWDALGKHLAEIGYGQDELLAAGLIIARDEGGTHDRFRNRLMFPVSDIRGRVTGFGARVLDDSLPKYLNSPQTPVFDKSSTLYAIDLAASAIREADSAVITEGYTDVITAHQHGFANVVATMGTAITEKQIAILKKLTKNIVLALDADAAGAEASRRGGIIAVQPSPEDLAPILDVKPGMKEPLLNEAQAGRYRRVGTRVVSDDALNINVRVLEMPEGKDPDSLIKENPEAWRDLLVKAPPVMDYHISRVTEGLDLATARDKTLAVDTLLPLIAEIKNPVQQAHYRQKLAQLVGVEERTLEAAQAEIKPAPSLRRAPARIKKAPAKSSQRTFSRPREEYCLALLLKYPTLKGLSQQPTAEYFQNSENQAIFTAWQQTDNMELLRDQLGPAIQEHLAALESQLDSLGKRELTDSQIEKRYLGCLLQLREDFLRNQAVKRKDALALEAELGGSEAELAKLREQGIEVSTQLGEVFNKKRTMR